MIDVPSQPASDQSPDRRALLHDALQAIETLEQQLDALESARNAPIAVIGMACRLPGGVDSPESFWQLLHAGRDAVTPFPLERRRIAQALGIDPYNAQGEPLWSGGFVDDLDKFDPHFFGISPREALSMDPQQRMVLEVAWEALERAGQAPDQLGGSATGVFLGISTNDYGQLVRLRGHEALDAYVATGGSMNVASGRLSFTLGLQGPCMAIDTACSSSLVAVHLAMQSLRSDNCSMAIAGGVNVVLMPEGYVAFAKWGMTAPNGRCKTFDASADGFVRAEGCGLLVCKRLSDALAAGDPILAVLRGSAINQDGRSSGLTVPNGLAQQAMLRAALASAGVEAADMQYIEAHGTGTAIGDPIEVEALGAVLGEGRRDDHPLFLGSVKTNIGHLESASGAASMIKVILSMQHGEIAPILHLKTRSPQIPWPAFPVEIPTTPTPWPARGGRRLAGVSGFGFSGTNAHIILESAPASAAPAPGESAGAQRAEPQLLVLSARSAVALRALVARYARHLADNPALDLVDVCQTAAQGRAHFTQRAAFVASTTAQMAQKLAAFAGAADAAGESAPPAATGAPPRVAFLFTGQGAQYAGMGAQLYQHAPVFRSALDRCAALLAPRLGRPLLDILFGDADDAINQTAYTQPALFALEYALSELWRSWGIAPAAVLGHSVGEYVAAVVAGVLSLEDGLALIAERGRLMQALPAGGAMAAIFAPAAQVQDALRPHAATLAIAAINGPAHTVISGAEAAVADVADAFAAAGVRVQRLTVSHAFHSPLMEPVLDPFARAAAGVSMHAPRIPLIANGTGAVAGDEITNPVYWRRHIRAAVQFGASLETLDTLGVTALLEVGPQPVLLGMARAMPRQGDAPAALPSLRKGHDEWEQMLASLGALYVQGAAIHWQALAPPTPWHKLTLPTYPFQRQRYWPELPAPRAAGQGARSGHPLLGRPLRSPLLSETIFETEIAQEQPAYLGDHRVQGQVVFPGSAYVEMALAAAAALAVQGAAADLSLRAMLTLDPDERRTLQLLLTPDSAARAALKIVSSPLAAAPAAGWTPASPDFTLHADGLLRLDSAAQPAQPTPLDLAALRTRLGAGAIDTHSYYAEMREQGLDYGPSFRGLAQLYAGQGEALGRVELPAPQSEQASAYQFHPALLDACFHVIGAAMPTPAAQNAERRFYIPLALEGVRVFNPGAAQVWCYARMLPGKDGSLQGGGEIAAAQLLIVDESGALVASVDKLELRLMSNTGSARRSATRLAKSLYEVAWRAQLREAPHAPAEAPAAGQWLICADAGGVGAALAAQLTAAGVAHLLLEAGAADPEALHRLLDVRAGDPPLRGVIYLGALDDAPAGAADVAHVAPASNGARLQRINTGALQLVQALRAHGGDAPRLYLATRGAQAVNAASADPIAATLWGFARALALEFPALHCTIIDLDPAYGQKPAAAAAEIAAEALSASSETQIALRGGLRYVARLARHRKSARHAGQPLRLALPERGRLEALTYERAGHVAPAAGQVLIAVRATGLNFRDVLNVMGMYPGDPGMPGLECAGVVAALGPDVTHLRVGDSVLALAGDAFDSYVLADGALCVRLPKTLSFADAVTLPSAYLTVTYGLHTLARLQPGERILIHAAAGGVGIAAVALAQRAGAQVYATAGSNTKRAFLRTLGVEHIYNSRTLDFADQIMADTHGAGVDVVLNSLADAFIEKSIGVLAPTGRFLEIGKRGIWSQAQFAQARPRGAYFPYDLTAILQSEPQVIYRLLAELMKEAAEGTIAPLPLAAFGTDAIVDAFRFMAQARHIGKVVLTHHPVRTGPLVRADGSYLVTGGLGGLGLTVAGWLAAAGARHLTLVGRSAPTAAAEATLASLRAQGVDVQVLRADISHYEEVAHVVQTMAATQPPLRGVIHAAGVLDDGILEQQRWQRFATVFAPKLDGALHLHDLTRTLPLDFFVLFSSASSVLGSAGQTNYAAANAALDMLAQQRRSLGLPALSINWGGWADVGMAAALNAHDKQRVAAQGIGLLAPQDGVAVLELLLAEEAAQVAVLPIDWAVLGARLAEGDDAPPFYAEMLREAAMAATRAPRADALADLRAAPTQAEQRKALQAYIADRVMRVLALDAAHMPPPQQPLVEIGMDSLMAVELKNRLEADLHVSVPLASLFEEASVHSLVAEIGSQLPAPQAVHAGAAENPQTASGAPPAQPGADAASALLSRMDELSDADVDALLTELLNEKGSADEQ